MRLDLLEECSSSGAKRQERHKATRIPFLRSQKAQKYSIHYFWMSNCILDLSSIQNTEERHSCRKNFRDVFSSGRATFL